MGDIASVAAAWELAAANLISDSPTSLVYRARQGDQSVIVKILKPEGHGEIAGMDFLRWRDGKTAVKVLAQHGDAYLLEDGGAHTIREFYDDRGDQEAAWELRNVVRRLHADSPVSYPLTLVPLDQHFRALFDATGSVGLNGDATLLRWAQRLARRLLAEQTYVRPLHGDVHYGNFVSTRIDAGWKAIDPKGLIGDPAYDFANIFGNPVDEPATVLVPDRCLWFAEEFHWHTFYGSELYGYHRDVTKLKLLQYAAVHSVLSACWSLEGAAPSPEEKRAAAQRLALAEILRELIAKVDSR